MHNSQKMLTCKNPLSKYNTTASIPMPLSLESTDHCLVDDVELFDKSFNVEEFEDDEDRRSDAYQDLANRHYA